MGAALPFSEITSAVPSLNGPSWLVSARKAAMERFAAAGLPSTRMETWRTTPLPEFGGSALVPGRAPDDDAARGVAAPFAGPDVVSLVFVDGIHSAALSSSQSDWPKGLRLAPLSRSLAGRTDDLQPWFTDLSADDGALHDLNTAAFRDGAWVVVEDGASIPGEIRVTLVSTSQDQPVAQHTRNLVRVGRGASLRMMVAVVGVSTARGFANNHTTISMAEHSRLDLVRVHESPAGVPHFDALSATLAEHSILNDTLLQTGPSWTRTEIEVALNGDRATVDLGGVFIARGTQVSDIHTAIGHQAPGVVSRQNFRGLAADESRGVFHGQIKVEAGGRGADATQSNKNLLLSRRATVHSTPGLEILTDDVKCKHGSATGQIDQAQLFYLRSRGIDRQDATRMLTRAFASEILSRLDRETTRELVESQIAPSLEELGVAE